jgi:hypothetical protein
MACPLGMPMGSGMSDTVFYNKFIILYKDRDAYEKKKLFE